MGSNPDYRFSTFEVDLEAGELYKRGVRVAVQDQPFRILRILLERAGQVVTREELRDQLWADGTFVDFDRGLNTAINKLREVLGDTPGHPRFIETVPRRGYRFIAEVHDLRQPPVADHREERSGRKHVVTRSPVLVAVLLGTFILAGLGVWQVARVESSPRTRITQLTSYSGNEREPSLSPDGTRVAFSWDGGQIGRSQIYVKQLSSERLLPLTADDADHRNPVWSADGQWIAFLRTREAAISEVIVIPALGGPERKLVELPAPWLTSTAELRPPVGHLAWSPDSKWLAITERNPRSIGLSLISVENNGRRNLTSPSSEWLGDLSPAFAPDGHKIAFIRSNAGMSLSEVYVLPLDNNLMPTASPTQVTAQNCWIANPVWMQNGEEIAFSCGQWGAGRRLFRTPIAAGRNPTLVGSVADDVYFLATSYSSHRMVYSQEAMDWDFWRVDFDNQSDSIRLGNEGERFLSSTRIESNAQYSPDGKRIAFESSRSGSSQIWVAGADGSDSFQLTSLAAPVQGFPRWSPDGKRIAFHSRPALHASIFVIDADGGEARQLTHTASEDTAPSWSPDGQWIYFCSRRSGDAEVWKVPAKGGSAIQVTKQGGGVAFEAGHLLWYSKDAGRGASLWKAPLAGGREALVLEGLANTSTYAVTPDGLYFIGRDQPEGFSLQYLEFSTQRTARLATIRGVPVLGLTISPDRRWLLYNRMDRRESDLMLMEHFR
jgi:Tol biopolymer transport system component/DNA-binding winged helix-turn-helix (wHTH) protein